ncbi:hypothetical protein [Pseudomonas sp. NPDC085632]|uniref:hypothetical protein n=1 Tax=Pseudomonas sp. NPDC085632 TaxID=3364429 RepID=UPI0037CBBFA3
MAAPEGDRLTDTRGCKSGLTGVLEVSPGLLVDELATAGCGLLGVRGFEVVDCVARVVVLLVRLPLAGNFGDISSSLKGCHISQF